MAPRKPKQPERRKAPVKRASVAAPAYGAARRVGRAVFDHPLPVAGTASFLVAFSFVAANAVWYQPHAHPAPFFTTRGPQEVETADVEPRRVTTFVIERETDEAAPATTDTEARPTGSVPAEASRSTTAPATQQGTAAADATLMADIQRSLAALGFYRGTVDGRPGPMTSEAIRSFQKKAGLAETGAPTPALLAALRGMTAPLARPAERPLETANLDKPARRTGAEDPIAAAIRSAETDPNLIPPAEIPLVASETVRRIQQGLNNLAYADVKVDGIAGATTSAAIRHFEKHYSLPETGRPNEAVLKKLKAIGAL
ncbi:Peptidoglycan-binding (PGRP) domain of peptidoglycan hydrolases-containing protein [Rhizobium sp. RU20A]|uniref:peptidoglycan-binding domain-containing protein n=1 Tax=Rhizobium sp. RU20A TaxID=1907412 RepID=UPI000955E90E|nr:peptidoglycan-binding protein [Rhizobium sp. RU20A]SIR16432.1 Peptidoglycan-binding (PGRP) domain of peptidoglycan hydrolases-containing protein [Rhizobium sp. RU20A]